jgi:Protein of unknown function (DUF551)
MSEWQPIETAPTMRTILLFAATDIGDDGSVKNWRMETGFWSMGHAGWKWGGYELRPYSVQPTHWMPLPEPPKE